MCSAIPGKNESIKTPFGGIISPSGVSLSEISWGTDGFNPSIIHFNFKSK